LRALIIRCLAKDPDARPRDMGVVRRELDQVARDLTGGVDSDALTQLAQVGGVPLPTQDRPRRQVESATDPIMSPQYMPTDRYTFDPAVAGGAAAPRRRNWLGPSWLAPTMLLLALTSAAIYLFKDRFLPVDSVAVLPFTAPTSNSEYTAWSEALANHITNHLEQNSNLTIASQEKVGKVKDLRTISFQTAAKRLQVRGLLVGRVSVETGGRELVVHAQFLDTWTDRTLWEKTFRRTTTAPASEIAEWQTFIGTEIAEAVKTFAGG
jgi:TolB-like protein